MALMHVVYLVYSYAEDLASPEALLARYVTIIAWAEAMAARGATVTVVQRFHHDTVFERAAVTYRFIADSYSANLHAWEIPRRCHAQVAACADDDTVVHFNGLLFPMQLQALRAALPAETGIVAQHHAERPWPRHRRFIQRAGLKSADAFLFTSAQLAEPWFRAGLISESQRCFEVMECPMAFQPADRAGARERTGMTGTPVLVWVGHLNDNKGPLTVLQGFEQILAEKPGARLYMVHSDAPLLHKVRDRIARSATLRRAVVLLGKVPHGAIEDVYNSSDYFVLGSRSEGSGYALAEAMSCGVVPVVTNIPSFRTMTNGTGALWQVGDAADFARAFLVMSQRPLALESDRVLAAFSERLSRRAVACDAMAAYTHVSLARRAQVYA